jgi:hypothetical protein
MNPHLGEGTLQRLLDGELSGPELAAAEGHLAHCAACRAEREALEGAFALVASGVSLLHPPAASLELAHASWRRRQRSRWPSHARRHLPRAALFVLAVAGVASATLPGSPVREWVESLWQQDAPAGGVAPTRATPPAEDLPAGVASAGVSIDPADGEVRVLVERASPALRIRVRLADQPRLSVRGTGGAADARFLLSRGRVTVEDAGAGELEVVIPRTTARASISAGGRQVLVKEGEELHVLVPADSVGTEIVFPAGS